jgi:hypothetical protein
MTPTQDNPVATWLPTACPIESGTCPPGVMARCRFALPILLQLIADEVMPLGGGCPFLHLCGLLSLLPDHPHRHIVAQASPTDGRVPDGSAC